MKKIGILVGSARKESYSKKIANHVATLSSEVLELQIVDISRLTMFNQDFDDEGSTPKEWIAFRKEIADLDGFIFITPEHNRSFPALLKNALDIASRPNGQNVWNNKPGGVISVSPGRLAGFGSYQQMRQVLAFLNINLLQQPEIYIGGVAEMLDDKGNLVDERMKETLQTFIQSFATWVIKF